MADPITIARIIDGRKLGPFQLRVIVLCAAVVLLEGFDTQLPGYVGPVLAKAWGLTPLGLSLFFSLGLAGLALGAVVVAPIADTIGRRPVLLASVAVFSVCSLATALSPSIVMLDIFRFLTGFGIGGALPNAIALTSEYVPQRRRALMVVLMFDGFVVGALAVGVLAAQLVPAMGWQSIFIVGGAVPLLLYPLLYAGLPESLRFLAMKARGHERAVHLLTKLDPHGHYGADTQILVDETQADTATVAALFKPARARTTLLLWTLFFSSLLDLFLITNWLPTEIRALGVPVETAILAGVVFQFGGLTGTVFGWFADKYGAAASLATAYLIGAACLVIIGLAGTNLAVVAVAVFGAGFGIVGGQTVSNAVAAIAYPTQVRATGVGWANAAGRVGAILGPSIAGFLFYLGMQTQYAFYVAAIPALIAAGAAASLGALHTQVLRTEKTPAE